MPRLRHGGAVWAAHFPATPDESADASWRSRPPHVLFLLNPGRFADRRALVTAIAATNYDVVVLDAWFDVDQPLSRSDVESLKSKPGGKKRIVLAYLSIGEAEDYRNDWDPSWDEHPPAWLGDENPDWPGNYAVQFWDSGWQTIVAARVRRSS